MGRIKADHSEIVCSPAPVARAVTEGVRCEHERGVEDPDAALAEAEMDLSGRGVERETHGCFCDAVLSSWAACVAST